MREFSILTMIIVAVLFLAPMIIGVVIFLICTAAIVILLARFGLLPGFRYVRYGGDPRGNKASWKWKWKYPGHGGGNARGNSAGRSEKKRDSVGGWYQTSQEGEEVTLPETALRKENDQKITANNANKEM